MAILHQRASNKQASAAAAAAADAADKN